MPAQVTSTRELDFAPQGGVFPSPADWRDQFIYFLLVDRFDNGLENPPAYDPAATPRGRDLQQGRVFQGGNLNGVTRRLDYIRGLGCSAIWLSPIFKNRQEHADTYHGYGIQNFLGIDPRFGTLAELRQLVDEAHARGMYVILDIILNHTGDNWAYPGDLPYYYSPSSTSPFPFGYWREVDPAPGLRADDAVWPMEFQTPDCYKRRGQIRNWENQEEAVNGDFASLKELDLGRTQVLAALIDVYKYWIAAADVDGYRIDTVKHMETGSTAIFCNAIREYAKRIGKQNFFLFGEVVGDDQTLQKYIGRNARIEGTSERFPSLDACLDFPLYFILEEALKGFGNLADLCDRYERFKTLYADHGEAGRYFVTFVDNHDQMCRPYRRFMHANPYTRQAVLAIGYLLTTQGVPCIYYGTEQGFDGGGDHDSYVRECMFGGLWGAFNTTGAHFFDSDAAIYQGIRTIADVRAKQPALRYGRQYFRETAADGITFELPRQAPCTLACSRILDEDEVLVAMNLDLAPRHDWITVDHNLTPPGSRLQALLSGTTPLSVQQVAGRACVRVPLAGHQIGLYKRE